MRITNKVRFLLLSIAIASAASAIQAQTPGRGTGRGGGRGGTELPSFWTGKKKLLVVADVSSGFHHDSISHAMATIERMGRESGLYMTMLRTDPQLLTRDQIEGQGPRYTGRAVNARTLNFYDGVFLLPAGIGTFTDKQKQDILSFVKDDGKGMIVGHAATVGYYQWPEFAELIGGTMASEFNANSTVLVEDPKFPGADAFGLAPFLFNEQHPVLAPPYSREKVHVILRLDPDKLSAADRARRQDGDFPLVWAREYGKGRMYNVGWGHNEETWDDPRFQKMMLGGIKWALGLEKADVTPHPFPGAAK